MNGWRLADPLWLIALVPALLAVWAAHRRDRRRAVLFSSVAAFSGLPVTLAQRAKRLLPVLRALGLAAIVVALARPQQGREETRVRAEGIDIVMCIDRSGSMRALDFEEEGEPVNRLEAVKTVFRSFVAGQGDYAGRPDDRIGLVVFGGYPEQRCPLTLDHGALLQVLDEVEIPGAGMTQEEQRLAARFLEEEAATAIGDALALSVRALRESDARSRIIILLSDGENTAGALLPRQAAEIAKAEGVKVYSIGIGSTGRAPFRATDAFGRSVIVWQDVALDEAALRSVAETAGGQYFNAKDTGSLEAVVAAIDVLEKTTREDVVYTDYREQFAWVLLPGIALLLLDLLLASTRFLTLP